MNSKEFVECIVKTLEESPDDWWVGQYPNNCIRYLQHNSGILIEIDTEPKKPKKPKIVIGSHILTSEWQTNTGTNSKITNSLGLPMSYWQKRKLIKARDACLREKAVRLIERANLDKKPKTYD